jgi:hypothetical protein
MAPDRQGPYESHPHDNETGHAGHCARHLAEVRARETRTPMVTLRQRPPCSVVRRSTA